ncbi:deleted in malignant brain tumors 1 protein-like [Ostrea edulis]|uniref:deleted in malignant brain tumors 1 protein-like n=1 Tax=Ostrea edulis TaxID=37623 RepID=UPI0024AF6F5A|nr:deleted in malignant brain tumors 1 protein-like [Ostrea edulis]
MANSDILKHAIARDSAHFGLGSGDIVLDDVSCKGNESSLALCSHGEFGQQNCSHSEDVGLICLDIRLVGGSSHNQGRLEIKLGNTWGTVCDDGWDIDNARVVCRMLGYSGVPHAVSFARFGQGSGQIWLDNVSCTGTESSIALCPSNGFGTHNCEHEEDAGVICHNAILLTPSSEFCQQYSPFHWSLSESINQNSYINEIDCSFETKSAYMFIMMLIFAVIFGVLQPMCGFLLDPNKPAHNSGGNDTITFMTQRLDKLQEQMVQQNKTLEIQGQMMGQLLNTLSAVNHSLSTLLSREHHNENQLSTFSSDLNTTQSILSSLQGTVSRNHQQVSSLSSQYTTMSSNLSTLSSDLQIVQSSLSSLQTTVSRNRHYASNHISSLTNQYSNLSTTLQYTETLVSTLEHNLEETVITNTWIAEGNYPGMGRLQLYYHDKWGTVCDDDFTSNSAKVACRQRGYAWKHAIARGSAYFGRGVGDIVLDDVSCRGDESSLALCRHREFGQNDCNHGEDVGVICLDIRLVGGSSHRQGRVEIRLGKTWGTVCDNEWDVEDARVVCRMLGYNGTVKEFSNAHFGQGSGQIWLENVNCNGTESSIALCPSNGFGTHNCTHGEDAGVICHLYISIIDCSFLTKNAYMFTMILTLAVNFGLLQLMCCFLLDPNEPTHHPGENDAITFMALRLDKLQEQMVQQNRTLEMQEKMMQQLLSISNQSPSTQSLSKELPILQTYVQRIMDEYHRLSNISDATDPAFKISSTATFVHILTAYQSSKDQIVRELKQKVSVLNETISLQYQETANQIQSLTHTLSAVNQSLSTLLTLEHHNENQLSTFSSDMNTTQSRLSSLQGTVSQNQRQISSLSSQYTTMSSNLSTLSSDLHSVQSSLSSLHTTVSRNQRNSSSHISSLTNQYSTLSTTLQDTKDRVSTLEHNLEETIITDTRITGGNYSGMGRLEVKYRGNWGTVCDDDFSSNNAKVACRQVGYPWIHATYKSSAYFGRGSGEIVLDNVRCRGDESSLALCRHNGFGQENCGHHEDVGVICLNIRLVGGSSHNQGRVEIKLGNTWGTICDDDWGLDDARVVCRMLGYSGTVKAFSSAHFGRGSGPIWLDNVHCTGSESSIARCPSNGFGSHNCGHGEDAGVICH